MFLGLENALFGSISQGLISPSGEKGYSRIGKYFHDMHLYASYPVGGNNNVDFHPIAASSMAIAVGIVCSIMANFVLRVVPKTFRSSFRIGLEGGAWVYVASIIYTAAQGWSAATKKNGSSPGAPSAPSAYSPG